MAKKAVKKTTRARRQKNKDISPMPESFSTRRSGGRSTTMERDYKDVLRDLASNPTVRYVAGGIAAAVLARIATNLSDRYPELSNFIKENLDTMEGRLDEFKSNLGESARH